MGLSISKEMQERKIVFLAENKHLIEVGIPSGKIKTLARYNYRSNPSCSFSPLIQNRFVYLVGIPSSSDVYYYDLEDGATKLHKGPSLCFETETPLLILFGSKLFAFSYGYGGESGDILHKPKCQFLDTASYPLEWRPLLTSPVLPDPTPEDIHCYSVSAYAINYHDLFLSLGGHDNPLAYCYNDVEGKWSNLSETRLPFFGEGKFVGVLCYVFSEGYARTDSSEYLAAYKLTIDWNGDAEVNCVELFRYSLLCDSPVKYAPSYFHSFFPTTDQNNLLIVRATKYRENAHSSQKHNLEVSLVKLLHDRCKRNKDIVVRTVSNTDLSALDPAPILIRSSSYARYINLSSVSVSPLSPAPPLTGSSSYAGNTNLSALDSESESDPVSGVWPDPFDLWSVPPIQQEFSEKEPEEEEECSLPFASKVLKHKSIPLPLNLEKFIGELYQ